MYNITFNWTDWIQHYRTGSSFETIGSDSTSIGFPKPEKNIKTRQGVKFFKRKDGEFIFGNCACTNIAYAFNIEYNDLKGLFSIIGNNNIIEDASHQECDKIIRLLGRINKKTIKYTPNKKQLFFYDFCKQFNKGTYIVSLPIHIAFIKDGKVIDDYCYNNADDLKKPIGWWKIK